MDTEFSTVTGTRPQEQDGLTMCASNLLFRGSTLRPFLWAMVLLGCTNLLAQRADKHILPNPNQAAAGHLQDGILTIRLEAGIGQWYPEEDEGPVLQVAAFGEQGGILSTPGPLLRVPEGTEIHVSIHNPLDQSLTMHGLHTRPGNEKDVLVVPSGESREVSFPAGAPGSYFYWGSRNGAETIGQRTAEDGQLNGALIVDPKSGVTTANSDRVLMITNWLVVDDDTTQPPKFRDVLGINGLSWPHTERLTYHVGETVHWRVINASSATHPMHLHGFYFRVDSVGNAEADTIYRDDQRRMAVTELLRPGRTFSLAWTPERGGNWVFHCHVLPHISPERRYWKSAAMATEHAMVDHAREGMSGLVMGITVLPADQLVHTQPRSTLRPHKLDLVATEVPGVFGKDPGMAFAIANRHSAIHPTIPGPPIVLTRGEPAAIRVVNRLREPLTVHWHGIELESYFDGVAGISGAGHRVMPPIAPRESFVAQMTPPRAGTFIYHTHMDDERQLSSGLYGALIVLPPGEKFDPESDRVLLISKAGPGEKPIWLNGSQSPEIGALKAGQKYRLRIINIVPENPPIEISLKVAGQMGRWQPLAKDGADLPTGQRELCAAKLTISVGETYDFEFRPERASELSLEVLRPSNRFPPQITPSHLLVELHPESRIMTNIVVRE